MLANAAKSNAAPVLSQHGERPISCFGRRDEMSKKLDREAFSKFVRVDSQLAGALTRGSSSTDAGDLNKVRMIGGFHELDPSDRDRGVVNRRRSVVQQQLFDDGRTGETRPPAEAHRQQETWRAQGRPIRLASGKVAIGPARNHRLADQAARLCLSQRDPDRGRDLLDGHGGPRDADGGLHNPGEGRRALFEYLRQCTYAPDASADLGWHRAPCRQATRLSCVTWLRSPAQGLRRKALRHHPAWHAGDYCR